MILLNSNLCDIALSAVQAINAKSKLSPLDFAHHREATIARALQTLFEVEGHPLKAKPHLDSNGEFNLEAQSSFGEYWAKMLTDHQARTGFPGPNMFIASNAWCRLNHFKAEALLITISKDSNV